MENLQLIKSFIDTIALCARSMIIQLNLFELIQSDATLVTWYNYESARWEECT